MEAIDGILTALADPTRRAAVELLRERPRRAGEIADALDKTPPAMSRHLRALLASGLVEEERSADDARVRLFRLRREPIELLRTWVEGVESYWIEQLGAFKAQAEKPRRRRKR